MTALAAAGVVLLISGNSGQIRPIELKKLDLFVTDGISAGGAAPPLARSVLDQAHQTGTDLFAEFTSLSNPQPARLSIAYLLVLDEDDQYLAHAQETLPQCIQSGEYRLWTYILDHKDSHLSQGFESRLRDIVYLVDDPLAWLIDAKHQLKHGRYQHAFNLLLNVISSGAPWDAEGYEVIMGVPEEHRTDLLRSYLNSPSARGAYAAYVLAQTAHELKYAEKYLRKLAKGSDESLASIANKILSQIEQDRMEMGIEMGPTSVPK